MAPARREIKVLLLIPNLGTGGAQKVFRQQLSFLSEHFAVYGCVFNFDGSFPEDRNENLHSLGVPGGTNTILKAWYFLLRIIRLRALKKKLGIDVSVSHLEGADYVNVLSRRSDKTICWIHGTKKFDENIEGKTGWLRKKIMIPILTSLADKIVSVSEGIRQELVHDFDIHPGKVATIYNGFNMRQIIGQKDYPLPQDFLFETGFPIVTHCRLSRQKNLYSLLQIYREVRNREDRPLIILGDGELREDLLRFGKSLNLQTYDVWSGMEFSHGYDVFFLGYQSNPYRFLSKASLYLMTSGWEGFPLALCEALACGVTVMSADCPTGPREILVPGMALDSEPVKTLVKGDFGLLMPVPKKDEKSLIEYWADHILQTLKDTQLLKQYSEKGPGRVKELDEERTALDVIDTIENLLR